jgi:hypothetical protein
MASAFGMIIKSFEIDGSTIPQFNTLGHLALENAHFADSTIPCRDVIIAHTFDN